MSFWQKLMAVWYTLLLALVPLIWLSNTSELFEFNKMIFTYILTTLILATWLIRMITEKRLIFHRTLLDTPLLAFLAFSLLSLVFSIDIHTSWFGYYSRWNGGVLSLFAYAALYWSYVSNMTYESSKQLLTWVLVAAAVVAVYAGFEHFGVSPSCVMTTGKPDVACWIQDVQNRVFGTLGQPNWLAAYLVSLIFIPMARFLKNKSLPALGLFALIFIVLLFTKSRSGLLAFGISGVVFWGFNRSIKNFLVLASCILLLVSLIPNPIRDLVIKSQTQAPVGPALEVGGTESGNIRKIVWTGAVRIWRGSTKNFLLGTGPETFAESYYQYRPVEHNQTSEWELLYNKAHNEFLNYLATTGFLGLGAYLIMLGVMGWLLFKSKNWALLAGWLTISVTNFWGFSVVIMQILLFILPAIGITLNSQDTPPKKSDVEGGQILMMVGIILVAAYLLFVTGRYWLADVKYASGQNLTRYFNATSKSEYLLGAYQAYQQAFVMNKNEPVIISEFGASAAYLANAMRSTNATSAAQLAALSIQAEETAIKISPHHPNYYKTAAKTAILLSDLDPKYLTAAYQYLSQAHELSPTDPRILYNMGVIAQYQNRPGEARHNYEQSLKLKPDFADPQVKLKELK